MKDNKALIITVDIYNLPTTTKCPQIRVNDKKDAQYFDHKGEAHTT